MKRPPLIFAKDPHEARKYATRHGIANWVWPRVPRDFIDATGRDLILLPGWQAHRFAVHAEALFVRSLREYPTHAAQRLARERSSPIN